MVFIARERNKRLATMAARVSNDGHKVENPFVYFKPIAQPHSNNPPIKRYSQSIFTSVVPNSTTFENKSKTSRTAEG